MVRHKDNEVILHFTNLGVKVIACMCQTGTHVRFSYIGMLTFLHLPGRDPVEPIFSSSDDILLGRSLAELVGDLPLDS